MSEWSIVFVGIIFVLGAANWFFSTLPRKNSVKVSFIAPSSTLNVSSSLENKVDAHIQSSNQKIALLFSRVELVERDVLQLKNRLTQEAGDAWLETVPVRNRKRA